MCGIHDASIGFVIEQLASITKCAGAGERPAVVQADVHGSTPKNISYAVMNERATGAPAPVLPPLADAPGIG